MNIRQVDQAARLVSSSQRMLAFTGAGISTESGIPDFRSPGGVWATSQPVYFDDFLADADARYEYWRQKSLAYDGFVTSQPNQGHSLLADWEQQGKLLGVITQNIDGLHQRAGSQRIWELHGTALEIGCLDCGRRFDATPLVRQFRETDTVPTCAQCGGLLKHATISFGQQLDPEVLMGAAQAAAHCDLFLALGSALVVHPAASLPEMAKSKGATLMIINRDPTPLDHRADIVIHAPLGETLQAIADQL